MSMLCARCHKYPQNCICYQGPPIFNTKSPPSPGTISPDAAARWVEVQRIVRVIAEGRNPPNEIESALCWAVTWLRDRAITSGAEQTRALLAVIEEREFQDKKHGVEGHTLGAWALVIEAELDEFKLAIIKGGKGRDNVINELIQIAATCVAALEQHGVEEIPGRNV